MSILVSKPIQGVFSDRFTLCLLLVTLFASCIIVYGSLISSNALPTVKNNDKLLHFIAYFGLAGLAIPAFPRRPLWVLLCAVILLGIGIEILQSQMSYGRQGSVNDVVANVIGTVLGVTFWVSVNRFWIQRKI